MEMTERIKHSENSRPDDFDMLLGMAGGTSQIPVSHQAVRIVERVGNKVTKAYDLGSKEVFGVFRMAGEGSGSKINGKSNHGAKKRFHGNR